jgi:RNA polymerase sigma factor (sigma-70 family)
MLKYELSRQRVKTAASESFESDEELAWRATYEVEAFQELYQRYNLPVYRYHIAWTGNEQDAQNLASQTFLEAYAWITSYRFGGCFVKWLFEIANCVRRDHFHAWGNNVPQDAPFDVPSDGFIPEKGPAFHIEIKKIAWAIDSLTNDMAEAFALRFFAGLSVSEIGLIMDKSDVVVKMLVYRGLCNLKVRLFSELEIQNV